MYALNKKLETEVNIEKQVYQVDLSFDNIMTLLEVLSDEFTTDSEKVAFGIYALLKVNLELSFKKQIKVFEGLMKNFVHDDESVEVQLDLLGNPMPVVKKDQQYDLRHDSGYIYTSFKQAYGIDLYEEQGKLDWRKFKMLLRDLPEETKFRQVIDIRQRPYPKGKGTEKERTKLKELKRHYALPSVAVESEY